MSIPAAPLILCLYQEDDLYLFWRDASSLEKTSEISWRDVSQLLQNRNLSAKFLLTEITPCQKSEAAMILCSSTHGIYVPLPLAYLPCEYLQAIMSSCMIFTNHSFLHDLLCRVDKGWVTEGMKCCSVPVFVGGFRMFIVKHKLSYTQDQRWCWAIKHAHENLICLQTSHH